MDCNTPAAVPFFSRKASEDSIEYIRKLDYRKDLNPITPMNDYELERNMEKNKNKCPCIAKVTCQNNVLHYYSQSPCDCNLFNQEIHRPPRICTYHHPKLNKYRSSSCNCSMVSCIDDIYTLNENRINDENLRLYIRKLDNVGDRVSSTGIQMEDFSNENLICTAMFHWADRCGELKFISREEVIRTIVLERSIKSLKSNPYYPLLRDLVITETYFAEADMSLVPFLKHLFVSTKSLMKFYKRKNRSLFVKKDEKKRSPVDAVVKDAIKDFHKLLLDKLSFEEIKNNENAKLNIIRVYDLGDTIH